MGLHAAIFENQYGSIRFEFPRRTEGCLYEGEASAEKRSFGSSGADGLSVELDLPAFLCLRQRAHKAFAIITVRPACAAIESCGNHRSVQRNPPILLPEENLK